jgi:hypothetical protein
MKRRSRPCLTPRSKPIHDLRFTHEKRTHRRGRDRPSELRIGLPRGRASSTNKAGAGGDPACGRQWVCSLPARLVPLGGARIYRAPGLGRRVHPPPARARGHGAARRGLPPPHSRPMARAPARQRRRVRGAGVRAPGSRLGLLLKRGILSSPRRATSRSRSCEATRRSRSLLRRCRGRAPRLPRHAPCRARDRARAVAGVRLEGPDQGFHVGGRDSRVSRPPLDYLPATRGEPDEHETSGSRLHAALNSTKSSSLGRCMRFTSATPSSS